MTKLSELLRFAVVIFVCMAATLLAYAHDLSGEAVTGIYGAALGYTGGRQATRRSVDRERSNHLDATH